MGLDQRIADVASRLRRAEQTATTIPPVHEELADGGLEAAYAVQLLNQEHAVGEGRRIVGRKIGLTSVAVQRQLGVEQPDFGVLFADMCLADGDLVPTNSVLQPRVEAEVALVVSRTLDNPDLTMFELVEAIEYLLPAIEIVGSRIDNWNITLLDTVADNASCGRVVLGLRPVRPAKVELGDAAMQLWVDDELVSTGVGSACLGHPYRAALWLARTMATVGQPLRAGDLVMTGALGPMVPVRPGSRTRAHIDGLGSVAIQMEAAG